jgi:hypothetical protein
MPLRFKIEPRDVPIVHAARRLGISEDDFRAQLSNLLARGFPAPDPTTGNFDLKAIEGWMDRRSGLGAVSVSVPTAKDASTVIMDRIAGIGRG